MNIVFKHISVHNFFSFVDAELDLNIPGYTLVQGINNNTSDLATSNGSGKSSIWEAISWGITGETIRGSKEVKNINASEKDKCYVNIEFDVDGINYSIYRQNSPSKLCFIVDNKDVSGKGIRDTEQIIREYLPDLTSSLLGSVVILGQGLPQRFSNNTPSGRKDILEKLSKSDFMIQDLKDRIITRKDILQKKFREYEDNILKYETEKELIKRRILLYQNSLDNLISIQELEDNIVTCENDLSILQSDIDIKNDKCKHINSDLIDYRTKLEHLQIKKMQEIEDASKPYDKQASDLKLEQAVLISEIKYNKQEVNKLKSIVDICPTCGQKIPDVHKPDTTELEQLISNLNVQLNHINEHMIDIQKEESSVLNAIDIKYESEKNDITENILQFEYEFNTLHSELIKLNDSYEQLQNELNEYYNDKLKRASYETMLNNSITHDTKYIEDIESKILYNNTCKDKTESHLNVVQKMNTVITRDFRGYLLSSVIEFISNKAKEYSQAVFETSDIDFYLDGNNIIISYGGKDYINLSGGERQKIDLIIQFAIRDMLCKYLGFSSNIIAVDELFDGLDDTGCERVINLISNKLSDVESIYVITHHSAIQIPCDNVITVIKGEDGISRIV